MRILLASFLWGAVTGYLINRYDLERRFPKWIEATDPAALEKSRMGYYGY